MYVCDASTTVEEAIDKLVSHKDDKVYTASFKRGSKPSVVVSRTAHTRSRSMCILSSTCARCARSSYMRRRWWRQVLGGGWAGFQVARDLDKDKYDVTVVR